MGVGKNTTSKSMDSSSEGGKYEEECKHGANFYPIPVHTTINKMFPQRPQPHLKHACIMKTKTGVCIGLHD